CQQENSLPPSF
nr:immunoglobulin light chain junction region [Macaca mulatta]